MYKRSIIHVAAEYIEEDPALIKNKFVLSLNFSRVVGDFLATKPSARTPATVKIGFGTPARAAMLCTGLFPRYFRSAIYRALPKPNHLFYSRLFGLIRGNSFLFALGL